MGIWGSHLYSVQPERLDELIQNSLRPYGECQKQIDDAVDTICAALQETEQIPTVLSVVQVSGRLGWGWGVGSGLPGARSFHGHQKGSDRVPSTFRVTGLGCTRLHLEPPSTEAMEGFRSSSAFTAVHPPGQVALTPCASVSESVKWERSNSPLEL